MKIAISYEQCGVGHEFVEHQTRKLCPLCEISSLKKERDKLIEITILLRGKIDAARNLCERLSHANNAIGIADVLIEISGDEDGLNEWLKPYCKEVDSDIRRSLRMAQGK